MIGSSNYPWLDVECGRGGYASEASLRDKNLRFGSPPAALKELSKELHNTIAGIEVKYHQQRWNQFIFI